MFIIRFSLSSYSIVYSSSFGRYMPKNLIGSLKVLKLLILDNHNHNVWHSLKIFVTWYQELRSKLIVDWSGVHFSPESGDRLDWILFQLIAVPIYLSQMDKRSWPWKRKSSSDKAAPSEKAAAILDSAIAASDSAKFQSDQVRLRE